MAKPCPFCNSTQLKTQAVGMAYSVNCLSCGAVGPTARNDDPDEGQDTATMLWDMTNRSRTSVTALKAPNDHLRLMVENAAHALINPQATLDYMVNTAGISFQA